jgi:hypothetical protein
MPLEPYEALAELRINCRLSGRGLQHRHCFGVHNTNPGWQADLADDWYSYCSDKLVDGKSFEYYVNTLVVVKLLPDDEDDYVNSDIDGPSGTNFEEPLPAFVAPKIIWRTGMYGRSYRGRTFMCGLSPSDVNFQLVNTAARDKIAAYADRMLEVFGESGLSGNFRFGVLSRQLAGVRRPEPIITPITEYTVPLFMGVNRHRSVLFHG